MSRSASLVRLPNGQAPSYDPLRLASDVYRNYEWRIVPVQPHVCQALLRFGMCLAHCACSVGETLERPDRDAIVPDLEVEMRPGGHAGRADTRYLLALAYRLPL